MLLGKLENNEIESLRHTQISSQNELKALKHKTWNYKTLKRKHRNKALGH